MFNKKNYLNYYKEMYFKNRNARIKKKFIFLFIFVMFTSVFVLLSFFIKTEEIYTMDLSETENVVNQAVSLKKKKLRTDFTNWNKSCDWNLTLVNNVNEMPSYFCPKLKQYGDVEVDERIFISLNEMLQEAAKNNIRLWVSSGFRSEERQKQLFDRDFLENLKQNNNKEDAYNLSLKKISLPRRNEHSTGLAVDFNAAGEEFCATKEYAWLVENSANYGFILRYPEDKEEITGRAFEPAHFRYVGEDSAQVIKMKNLCLEEYISSLMK